jgi:hypothetical protein
MKKLKNVNRVSMENWLFLWLKTSRCFLGGNGVLLCTFELCHDEMPMFPLFQLKESKSRERLQVGPAADVFLGNKILDLIKLSGEWTQTGSNEETGPSILTRPLPDSLLSTFVFSFFGYQGAEQPKNCSNASSSHAYAIYCMIHMNV